MRARTIIEAEDPKGVLKDYRAAVAGVGASIRQYLKAEAKRFGGPTGYHDGYVVLNLASKLLANPRAAKVGSYSPAAFVAYAKTKIGELHKRGFRRGAVLLGDAVDALEYPKQEAEDPKKTFRAAKAASPGLPELYVRITIWMRDRPDEPWTTNVKCEWMDHAVSTGDGWEAGIKLKLPEGVDVPEAIQWNDWHYLLEVIEYNIMEGPQDAVIEDDADFTEDLHPHEETPPITRAHWKVLGNYPLAQERATKIFGGPHNYFPGGERMEGEEPKGVFRKAVKVPEPPRELLRKVIRQKENYLGAGCDSVSTFTNRLGETFVFGQFSGTTATLLVWDRQQQKWEPTGQGTFEAEDPRQFLKSMSWSVRPIDSTVYMVQLFFKGELEDTISIDDGWTIPKCAAIQDYMNWLDRQVPYVPEDSIWLVKHWLLPAEQRGFADQYMQETGKPAVKVLTSSGIGLISPQGDLSGMAEAESPKATIKQLPRSQWSYTTAINHDRTYVVQIYHRGVVVNSYFYIETEEEAKELGEYWVKWYQRLERQLRYAPEQWKTFHDWYSKAYGMQMKTQRVTEAEDPKSFLRNVPQRTIEVQITRFRGHPMDARVQVYFASRGITLGERELPGLFITGRDVQLAINQATADVPRRVTIMSMSEMIADHIRGAVNEGGEVSNLDDRLHFEFMNPGQQEAVLAWKVLAPRELLHYFKNARAYTPEQIKELYKKFGDNIYRQPPKGWDVVEAESPKDILSQAKSWAHWRCTSFNAVEMWLSNVKRRELFCRVQLLSDGPNYQVDLYINDAGDSLRHLYQENFTLPKFDFNDAAARGKQIATRYFTKTLGEAETPKGIFKAGFRALPYTGPDGVFIRSKSEVDGSWMYYSNLHGFWDRENATPYSRVAAEAEIAAMRRDYYPGYDTAVTVPVSEVPWNQEAETPKKAMGKFPAKTWYAYVRRRDGSRVYLKVDGSVSGTIGEIPAPFTATEKQRRGADPHWKGVEWDYMTESEQPKRAFKALPRDYMVKWSFGDPNMVPYGAKVGLGGFRYRIVRGALGPDDALAKWRKMDAHLISLADPRSPVKVDKVFRYDHDRLREAESPKGIFKQLERRHDWTVTYRDLGTGERKQIISLNHASAEEAEASVYDAMAHSRIAVEVLSAKPYRPPRRRRYEAESPKGALKKAKQNRTELLHLFRDMKYVRGVAPGKPPIMLLALDAFQRQDADGRESLFSVVNLASGYAFHQKAWKDGDGALHTERMFKSQDGYDIGTVPWDKLVAKIP